MPRTPGKCDLSTETKVSAVLFMASLAASGSRATAAVNAAIAKFSLSARAVWGLWKDRVNVASLLAPPRRIKVPKPTKRTREEDAAQVAAVPVCERQTLPSLSEATGIPTTTLWRYVKAGRLRRAVSHVKPALTDAHKVRRLIYCMMHVHRPKGTV
ncbi:hypothetical protein PI124_g22534 [Phytophthora idaei]|nr:hypothetical protein PI125_g25564 [Phytophthora idaei]KAG3125601.1 hypothetical protein PI126_g22689 [Phytophthora idaei]KAG3232381.1 hypothetical protein PI124_g22534 [Phytophthora idaei]